jgi:rod shape-determining protein MreB
MVWDMKRVFGRDLAIDLGTANTLIYEKGVGILLNEPSMVALREVNGKRTPVAYGSEAKTMLGKTPEGVVVIRPVRTGVIADFEVASLMLRHFISRVRATWWSISKPRIMVGVPCGITEVEKRAIREAVEGQAREVRLIDEAMAAAIGCDLPVTEAVGSLVVDIGGGTTDIAIISMKDMVCSASLRQGGDALDEAIVNYMRRRHHVLIGEATAEQIKKSIGTAHPDYDDEVMEVRGRSLIHGTPTALMISGREVREAMSEVIGSIVLAIRQTLENTPPELAGDIIHRGLALAGGGALVRGLGKRLSEELELEVTVPADPLGVVAEGAGKCLDHSDVFEGVWLS